MPRCDHIVTKVRKWAWKKKEKIAKAVDELGKSGAPERTRTSDARFRKPTLYPLSYGGKKDADKQLCYLNTPLLHST